MSSLVPLPSLAQLARYSRSSDVTLKDLAKPWLVEQQDVPHWFARGAYGLAAVGLWFQRLFGEAPTVYVPDYFCNQSLTLLRRSAGRLVFYPITAELVPDWEAIEQLAVSTPPQVFVLVHYFGHPSDAKAARRFCKNYDAILLEDAAHCLLPTSGVGVEGDFVLFSLHKTLPLPDGALLVQRVKAKRSKALDYAVVIGACEDARAQLGLATPSPARWLGKRIVQKALMGMLRYPKPQSQLEYYPEIGACNLPATAGLSEFAGRLLASLTSDLSQYAQQRRINDAAWILGLPDGDFSRIFPKMERDEIPYLAAFRVVDPTQAERIYERMRLAGIWALPWPDLAPEVLRDKQYHCRAIALRASSIFFPVHQSVGVRDILADVKRAGLSRRSSFAVECREIRDRVDWDLLFAEAYRPNLLQSWAYGDAKHEVEGWQPRRYKICIGDQVVALVQVLVKSFAGLRPICRINRGPIWMNARSAPLMQDAVLRALRHHFGLRSFSGLLVAPELPATPLAFAMLEGTGYHKRSQMPWQSAYIDLQASEEDLRKGLDGKWRNLLKKSEQSGLRVMETREAKDFDELLGEYIGLMQQKDFVGPSPDLLRACWKASGPLDYGFVLRAEFDGVLAGAILIAAHGSTATYLVGWNGELGRTHNANNLLLWNALLACKKRGQTWFDVGGVSDGTASVSHFKRGLAGNAYELTGEWWG